MQKLAFFKGLIIGLSLSSFLWGGIFVSMKKIVPMKDLSFGATIHPASSIDFSWSEELCNTPQWKSIALN